MKILIGNILQSEAQTLVNTVNCVGVMGKGIALEFKKRFPEMYEDYLRRSERREVKPGLPYLYKSLMPPQIVNFPTKDHWKSISKIADIERGLQYLLERYKEWGVTSLAVPPLGCGNGQLEWRAVGPLIYKYAKQMDIHVEIYAPYGTAPRELTVEFLETAVVAKPSRFAKFTSPALNPAWVALVEILNRIETQPYHWPVGRTIFQKIAYVATRQGLPTGFIYERGSFGPFSKRLKAVETQLINNDLLREERLNQWFMVRPGPSFPSAEKSFKKSLDEWSNLIDKTTDLFVRLNTNQAEIVATVMFAADELKMTMGKTPTETEVLKAVMQWKQKRRPPLQEDEVASTISNLGMLRWLDVKPDASLAALRGEAVVV